MPESSLSTAVSAATAALATVLAKSTPPTFNDSSSLQDVETVSRSTGIPLDRILAGAALSLAKNRLGLPTREQRSKLFFVTSDRRPPDSLIYTSASSVTWRLPPDVLLRALLASNLTIEVIHDISIANMVPTFQLLGLRNLSSFVGEIFARELCTLESGKFMSNPNQDGYPDLCALTPEGTAYVATRAKNGETSAKQFWSPYPFGGVEVKATCGNTPPARKLAKPGIGESRYPILDSAEWKAHHRETNNLLGIYWDFVDGLPTILAVFFRNDLMRTDWGEIIQPKQGGGKTTSVSIMTRPGVEKMGKGWVVLPDSKEILSRLAQPRVFALTSQILRDQSSLFANRFATSGRVDL